MDAKQKRIAIIAGAAIALYLLYRWYSGSSASSQSAAAGTPAPDTSASDFASLAGQEQSDVAGLQGQNSQLLSQEQSDVQGLQGLIQGLGSQEQSDVSGLTGAIGAFGDPSTFAAQQASMAQEVAALAAGQKKMNRTSPTMVKTHKGGAFYNYYVKVTGHAPPAAVQTSNFVWQAFKRGVKATALQKHPPHPSAPKQTHVAHPNPAHKQQQPHKPSAPPPKTVAKPHTKPKAPPKPRKPQKSGVRR